MEGLAHILVGSVEVRVSAGSVVELVVFGICRRIVIGVLLVKVRVIVMSVGVTV